MFGSHSNHLVKEVKRMVSALSVYDSSLSECNSDTDFLGFDML